MSIKYVFNQIVVVDKSNVGSPIVLLSSCKITSYVKKRNLVTLLLLGRVGVRTIRTQLQLSKNG